MNKAPNKKFKIEDIIDGDTYKVKIRNVEINAKTGEEKNVKECTKTYARKTYLEELDRKDAKLGDNSYKRIFLYFQVLDAESGYETRGDYIEREQRTAEAINLFLNKYKETTLADVQKVLLRAELLTSIVAIDIKDMMSVVPDIINNKGEKCKYFYNIIFNNSDMLKHFFGKEGFRHEKDNLNALKHAGHIMQRK